MNRARVENRFHTRAQNRKLLAGLVPNPGENEYAEPALNPLFMIGLIVLD